MNPHPAGRADLEIGAPIGVYPRLNFARQKTCKSLLQVKQRFVIHLKTSRRSRATAGR